MSGELAHCMRCLARFGREPDAPRVLLLSSQHQCLAAPGPNRRECMGAGHRPLATARHRPTRARLRARSASGINLQCARNLIVVHPYCTPSAGEPEDVSFAALQAFEAQAIGRIRRYPQTQTVRVHRLFAAESVEEGLYRGGFAQGEGRL